jgi:hypothetical protein
MSTSMKNQLLLSLAQDHATGISMSTKAMEIEIIEELLIKFSVSLLLFNVHYITKITLKITYLLLFLL